jgi:hypothetical protein
MYWDGTEAVDGDAVDAGGGPAAKATEDRAQTLKRLSIFLIANPLN